MKIAFLSRYQQKLQRGAENFVSELSERLSGNHQVDVLSGLAADDLSGVKEGKYNIVIPINGGLQSFKASVGRITGKYILSTKDCNSTNYKLLITGHSGIGRDDIWNIAVCKPDVFVALTDYMAVWAKKWAWGSTVVKIPNGIDLNKFNPEGNKIEIDLPKPIVLSVGALVWYKHHEKVIRAMANLKDGSLLIVGEGPNKENLEKLGRDSLGNRFKLLQFPYEEMPKVYRSVDLFSLPSWNREAFGLVYLEAMASGLGVVAPRDLSRKEIVGNGGILTDTENAEKYSQAIKQALSIDWSEKSRVQAEKFSWEFVANEYEKLMRDIVNLSK